MTETRVWTISEPIGTVKRPGFSRGKMTAVPGARQNNVAVEDMDNDLVEQY